MSFAQKTNESRDVAKLRAEYDKAAQRVREAGAAERENAKKSKAELFGKLANQISGERKEAKTALQKVLIQQGSLKSKEEHKKDVEAAKAAARSGAH